VCAYCICVLILANRAPACWNRIEDTYIVCVLILYIYICPHIIYILVYTHLHTRLHTYIHAYTPTYYICPRVLYICHHFMLSCYMRLHTMCVSSHYYTYATTIDSYYYTYATTIDNMKSYMRPHTTMCVSSYYYTYATTIVVCYYMCVLILLHVWSSYCIYQNHPHVCALQVDHPENCNDSHVDSERDASSGMRTNT
jgi:hypothetical protein